MHINSLSPYSTLPSFTVHPKSKFNKLVLLAKNNMETLVISMNTGFMTVRRGREYQDTHYYHDNITHYIHKDTKGNDTEV